MHTCARAHTHTRVHTHPSAHHAHTHPHTHMHPRCPLCSPDALWNPVSWRQGPSTTIAAEYGAQNLPDASSFPLGHSGWQDSPVAQPGARCGAAGRPGQQLGPQAVPAVRWAGPWRWTRASSFSRGSSRQPRQRPGFRVLGSLRRSLQEEKGTLWALPADARLLPPGSGASAVTACVHPQS